MWENYYSHFIAEKPQHGEITNTPRSHGNSEAELGNESNCPVLQHVLNTA